MTAPRRINAEDLHERMLRGERTAIIDIREPEEYRALHASGALLLPLGEISAETVAERLTAANYPPDILPYFICHSGRRATEACERVLAKYPDATIVEGGTLAWAQAGFPVHSGDEP